MLGCKMLKASLPDHQTIWLLTNNFFLCSNIYSLHAHCFVTNVLLSFWDISINYSDINIS